MSSSPPSTVLQTPVPATRSVRERKPTQKWGSMVDSDLISDSGDEMAVDEEDDEDGTFDLGKAKAESEEEEEDNEMGGEEGEEEEEDGTSVMPTKGRKKVEVELPSKKSRGKKPAAPAMKNTSASKGTIKVKKATSKAPSSSASKSSVSVKPAPAPITLGKIGTKAGTKRPRPLTPVTSGDEAAGEAAGEGDEEDDMDMDADPPTPGSDADDPPPPSKKSKSAVTTYKSATKKSLVVPVTQKKAIDNSIGKISAKPKGVVLQKKGSSAGDEGGTGGKSKGGFQPLKPKVSGVVLAPVRGAPAPKVTKGAGAAGKKEMEEVPDRQTGTKGKVARVPAQRPAGSKSLKKGKSETDEDCEADEAEDDNEAESDEDSDEAGLSSIKGNPAMVQKTAAVREVKTTSGPKKASAKAVETEEESDGNAEAQNLAVHEEFIEAKSPAATQKMYRSTGGRQLLKGIARKAKQREAEDPEETEEDVEMPESVSNVAGGGVISKAAKTPRKTSESLSSDNDLDIGHMPSPTKTTTPQRGATAKRSASPKKPKSAAEAKAKASDQSRASENAQHDSQGVEHDEDDDHEDEDGETIIFKAKAGKVTARSASQSGSASASRNASNTSHTSLDSSATTKTGTERKLAPAEKVLPAVRVAIIDALVVPAYTKHVDFKGLAASFSARGEAMDGAKLSRHWREVLSADLKELVRTGTSTGQNGTKGSGGGGGGGGKGALGRDHRIGIWEKVYEKYEKADWNAVSQAAGGMDTTKLKRHLRDVLKKDVEKYLKG